VRVVKVSGSIRQEERTGGRTVPSREAPETAFRTGTAPPGPALTSGPGFSLLVDRTQFGRTEVFAAAPSLSALISYFIPSEWRLYLGVGKKGYP